MLRGWLSEGKRRILAVLAFGVAFGYVEAAIVDYLRALYEPIRQRFYPGRAAGDVFPLLTLEQLSTAGPGHMELLAVETAREAATIVMLATVALAAAGRAGQWLASFAVAFGTWDISFYVFLKVLVGWPDSLLAWDVLFLIPVPWAGPVLAPVLVSISMIAAGLIYLWRDSAAGPVRLHAYHWLGFVLGGLVVILSFVWDYRNIATGGMPRPFHWPLFALGELTGLLVFVHALVRPRRSRSLPVGAQSTRL